MSATLGDRVLDWMLRRLRQAVQLDHDLVLVHDAPVLADVSPSIEVGDPWRVARVTGELTLRDALPEADRLIAIVPESFPPLPLDIASRTYLRRILDVRAEDVVAAAAGRPCEALVDESLVQGVFDSLDALRATADRWSFGALVSAREVRSVLVSEVLGAGRLDRERDWELLARWILKGVPAFRAKTLVRTALEEAHPRTGKWLAWALDEGSLEGLSSEGALMTSSGAKGPNRLGVSSSEARLLIELVDMALREVWRTSPARAREMLLPAETIARQTKPKSAEHRLLRNPLEGDLADAMRRSADGSPLDDTEIQSFRRNLHAGDLRAHIDIVADVARLARSLRQPTPAEGEIYEWFEFARRDIAWADLAYRRVRRTLETVPAWLTDPAKRVLAAWVERRDELNRRFAESLSSSWANVARSTDPRHPVGLHQVTRTWVRRLADDGHYVCLLVLDGCDLASFLELAESVPADRRLGLALPEVRSPVLRDDLAASGAWSVAISALPTVTSHSRRALFAGEIPGNTALDETESAIANATADQRAWSANAALGDLPRRLFLKGDLKEEGQALVAALRDKRERVVAAVFNGVDDALSSKETTPLPTWSLAALGTGALQILETAIAEGWTVLLTADHGHTPFVASDRKAGATAVGQRFGTEATDGSVAFKDGPLPRKPLHLLTRFGGWFGQQRRGFHGGAGIEEVVVPFAFFGMVRGEQEGRPRAPGWWWSLDAPHVAELEQAPARQPASAETPAIIAPAAPPPAPGAPLDRRLDSLSNEEKVVLSLLRTNQSARLSVIAQNLRKTPMRTSGFMQQLVRKVHELGYPCLHVERLPDGESMYRYSPPDRESR